VSWFRRAQREDRHEDVVGDQADEVAAADEPAAAEDARAAEPTAEGAPASDQAGEDAPAGEDEPALRRGPWDVSERPDLEGRIDLGALRVPPIDGMQVRMEVDKRTGSFTGAAVALRGTVVQLQAFAAPRVEAIWPEIRSEIAASATKQGGTADEVPGPFGTELLARLPFTDGKGATGHRPARFVGVDGPRWFVRAVISGRGAVDTEAAREFEDLIAGTVVVRGTEARPPRDVLALRLPDGAPGAAEEEPEAPSDTDFNPLRRGPEITEIR